MASNFLELLERIRAGENLPSRQASSFPASIAAPFSPQQQGFLFSQNAVAPIEQPAPARAIPLTPNIRDDGDDFFDPPDVESLPGTPGNFGAALGNLALAAIAPSLALGLGVAQPNALGLNPVGPSFERQAAAELFGSFGLGADAEADFGPAGASFDEDFGGTFGGTTGAPGDFGPEGASFDEDFGGGLGGIGDIDAGDVGPGGGFGDEGASFDEDFDDAGDADAGDDKIICAELHRQGYMPDHIYEADEAYGAKLPSNVLRGYHWWANPAVRWMKRSRFATGLARQIALPWAHHMAYLMGAEEKDNRTGRLIMVVGYPLCRLIGDILDVRETYQARRGIDGVPGSN